METEMDTETCPAGHEMMFYNQRWGCPTCTKNRRLMRERKAKNVPAGRHPRETLTRVPNQPLRERLQDLLAQGAVDVSCVALAAGYVKPRSRDGGEQADVQRLKKQLGIAASKGKRIDPETGTLVSYYAERVDYESAVRLCKALGVEYPSEMGI
jgi:hypothetical protein